MAMLANVEGNPSREMVTIAQAQPSSTSNNGEEVVADTLVDENSDSDSDGDIPSHKPGTEPNGSIQSEVFDNLTQGPRNLSSSNPSAQIYRSGICLHGDDQNEEGAEDMARTINAGLSSNNQFRTTNTEPGGGSGSLFGRRGNEIRDLRSQKQSKPVPESNTSRKRATDATERTPEFHPLPVLTSENLGSEIQAESTLRQSEPPKNISTKNIETSTSGKLSPYDDFGTDQPSMRAPMSRKTNLNVNKLQNQKQKFARTNASSRQEAAQQSSGVPVVVSGNLTSDTSFSHSISGRSVKNPPEYWTGKTVIPGEDESADDDASLPLSTIKEELRGTEVEIREGITALRKTRNLQATDAPAAKKNPRKRARRRKTAPPGSVNDCPPPDLDREVDQESSHEQGNSLDDEGALPVSNVAESELIEPNILKDMLKLMHKVGRKKDNDKDLAAGKKHSTPVSQEMVEAIGRAIKMYEQLKENEEANEPNRAIIRTLHRGALVWVEELESYAANVTSNILRGQSSDGSNENSKGQVDMLTDLYLFVIPKLVDVFVAMVNAYQIRGSLNTTHLEEISRLLKILDDLLAAASGVLKKDQLSGQGYAIIMPSRSLYPIIRDLHKRCKNELKARAAETQAIEYRRTEPERKRKRDERDSAKKQAEKDAYQERLKQHHQQAAAQWKSRIELGLVPSSQIMREFPLSRETEAVDATQAIGIQKTGQMRKEPQLHWENEALNGSQVAGTQFSVEGQLNLTQRREALDLEASRLEADLQKVREEARKLRRAEELQRQGIAIDCLGEDGNPSYDENDDGRLHMFGENNRHLSASKAWSRIEVETLVDGLRHERGRDRYEIIATRLDRSYDEIFVKAKEFRIAMEESLERKRQENPHQHPAELEDWITCIGFEFEI